MLATSNNRSIAELSMLSQQGYEELRVSNERAKEELRAREHQHREQQAELLGLKTQVGQMQKELEKKSVELASASKALEEAENQKRIAESRAGQLETSCSHLQHEHQTAKLRFASLQKEHELQKQHLERSAAADASASSTLQSDALAAKQRHLAVCIMNLSFVAFRCISPRSLTMLCKCL